MKRSTFGKKLGNSRRLLFVVMATVILTTAAFSQQEVDPTWHDPWAPSNKAAIENSKSAPTPNHKPKRNTQAVARHTQSPAHANTTAQARAVCKDCKHSQTR